MTKHTGKTALSLSGGKDSTAVLLRLIELGRPPDAVVFFDGGWEFPDMYHHIMRLKVLCISHHIGWATVHPQRNNKDVTFDYIAWKHIKTKGVSKGCTGYGWPHASRRWCTCTKVDAIDKWCRQSRISTILLGLAFDEQHRAELPRVRTWRFGYPLVEWGWTEDDCLKYCLNHGYDWDGLYDHFRRVSCWCCPLQRLNGLRNLWAHFPGLWARLEWMQTQITRADGGGSQTAVSMGFTRNRKGYGNDVAEWTRRFEDEHKAADELRKR